MNFGPRSFTVEATAARSRAPLSGSALPSGVTALAPLLGADRARVGTAVPLARRFDNRLAEMSRIKSDGGSRPVPGLFPTAHPVFFEFPPQGRPWVNRLRLCG
ncbi:hypothetical protein NOGI109294_04485 [Nocardiopsis gilva]